MYTDSLHTTVFGGRCHLTAARFHFEYPEYADHEQILPVMLGRSSDGASRKNCKTNFGTAGMGHWPYIILFTSSITCGWNILILPNAEL